MWTFLREHEKNKRSEDKMSTKVLPITIRTHETLIRLSTAHAKLRMSPEIEPVDCFEAFKLVTYSLEGN